jgi:hypothetical protein
MDANTIAVLLLPRANSNQPENDVKIMEKLKIN